MEQSKILILLLLFFAVLPERGFPDFVYLKNGNTVEGIIDSENEHKLSLNIGYGIVTLEKKSIEYIERYSPGRQEELKKSWLRRYFMRPEFLPDSLKDIARDFENLETLRDSAIRDKKETDTANTAIEKSAKDLEQLNTNLALISQQLSKLNPEKNFNEYNAAVNEFNSLIARIKLAEYIKSQALSQIGNLDQKISGYINEFGLFKKKFRQISEILAKELNIQEQNKYFFEEINKKLNSMDNDFTRHQIAYKKSGSSLTVNCLLNGSVKANLILDTGATLVVISQDIAAKLGTDINNNSSPLLVTLANGQQVKSTPLILESIKVGDVELKKVNAAVIETRGSSYGEDGLLGMSFLENFLVKIDAKANNLILEQFNP